MYVILVRYPGERTWEQIDTRATEQDALEACEQYEADPHMPGTQFRIEEA